MTRNSVRTPFVLLIAALLLATAASATTVRKLNDSQMIAASDVVVVGQCIQMKSEWVGRNLMTRYTFKVDEVWSGAAKKTIHIVVPGGADANRKFPVATVYPGAPIFMPNERAVLLLDEMSGQFQGAYSVVGFNQGRFTIGRGEITAAKSSASTAEPQLQRRERDALTKLRARFGQLIAAKGAR